MKLKKIRQFPLKGIFAAMMTAVTSNWAASAIYSNEMPFAKIIELPESYRIWIVLFIMAMFILSVFALYEYRLLFLPVKSLSRDEVAPHKCLIIPVSNPYPVIKAADVSITNESEAYKISVKKSETKIDVPQKGITHDIELLEGTRWSWQQMLRCIEPHKDRLKHVYLIGSPSSAGDEKKGSYNSLCAAEFLIKHYVENIKVHKHPLPIDFEDFDGLKTAFNKAIELFKEEGIPEKDIIIDITGGQKPVSIAGAIATLDKNVTFQYVQTTSDKTGKYKVWAYDVIVQPPTL